MNILVIGSTGMVGSSVAKALIDKGINVRCMSHTPDKVKKAAENMEPVIADLDKRETLGPAFEGVDNVFMLLPVGVNETAQGLAVVDAAKAAGVRKIVYMSVVAPVGSDIIPHFLTKIPVENAVKKSGIDYTILQPNHFFQNDISVLSIVTAHGIYPIPIGSIGLNRVDVRDIADAAVNALTQTGYERQTYPLHGPDTLNGRDMARIYSKYVGRDVRYAGDNLDVWERHVRNVMAGWRIRDMRVMFKFFQDHGMIAPEADLEREHIIMGHEPRKFDDFAREISLEWKQSLACAA